jgi:hypothetical protein
MGIANPRPAMRHREERGIHGKLAHHSAMLRLILNSADGSIDASLASHEAARLTQTRKARKAIWETKRHESGPADISRRIAGLADAARRCAAEESAMATAPPTNKIQ